MAAFDPAMVTAAILAGGAGSRLHGRDKGLELLAGQPLIAHVIAALANQAGALLICANRNTERYGEFAPVYSDRVAGFAGPLAGIAAALAACKTEWLLTVPVDCPRPPRDLVARLRAHVGAARASVARSARREPLFALYRRELAADAAIALEQDDPVWRWQESISAVEVDFPGETFVNLNTPEDFRHWEQQDG
jgi:molybdenum cofactor guanylyltransferase